MGADAPFKRERFERGDVVEDTRDGSIYVLKGIDAASPTRLLILTTIFEKYDGSVPARGFTNVSITACRKIGHIEVPDE